MSRLHMYKVQRYVPPDCTQLDCKKDIQNDYPGQEEDYTNCCLLLLFFKQSSVLTLTRHSAQDITAQSDGIVYLGHNTFSVGHKSIYSHVRRYF